MMYITIKASTENWFERDPVSNLAITSLYVRKLLLALIDSLYVRIYNFFHKYLRTFILCYLLLRNPSWASPNRTWLIFLKERSSIGAV